MYKILRIAGIVLLVAFIAWNAFLREVDIVPMHAMHKQKAPSDEAQNPRDFAGADTLYFRDSAFIMHTVVDSAYQVNK